MKIYILQVEKKFQPKHARFKYPRHNSDKGVEQDFLEYLYNNKKLLTDKPSLADWHYLPIYWTRWHLNHDYAKTGLKELQNAVNKYVINEKKTFTICQYDDGPVVDTGKTKLFLSSRKSKKGIDIPLLSSHHKLPFFKPKKKYRACFVGRLSTHPLRKKILEDLKKRKDVFIYDGIKSSHFFVKKMLASNIALCPRGYGGSSFRIFEAMQLGIVPFVIGDIDTRPFKKFIDWDKISLYSNSVDEVNHFLDSLSNSDLISMGKRASEIWRDELSYQKWCKYVIKELDLLK